MKRLAAEYVEVAHRRLATAHAIVDRDPASALSTAYYAGLYAARATLHEHDIAARSHRGIWHEFRNLLVLPGHVDADIAASMQRLQTVREQADYDAADVSADDAREAIEIVGEFVKQVTRCIEAPEA